MTSNNIETLYNGININDEWKTPREITAILNKRFKIYLDACCLKYNIRSKLHYTKKDNGLKKKWYTWTYCNPPYSVVAKFLAKGYKEYKKGINSIFLIFSKTETKYFQQYAFKSDYILFINKRLKFLRNDKKKTSASPFGSCLIVFGKLNRYQQKDFKKLGYLIKLTGG